MKSPHSQPNPAWTIVLTACLQSFILSAVPGLQAYAATGMSAPVQPFDDPTWKALIGLGCWSTPVCTPWSGANAPDNRNPPIILGLPELSSRAAPTL